MMRTSCFLAGAVLFGCCPLPPVQDGDQAWPEEFCERWVPQWVADGDEDSNRAEAALCQLRREGEVSNQVFADFCRMDFDKQGEILDVETLCTVDPAPEEIEDFNTTLRNWREEIEQAGCGDLLYPMYKAYVAVCDDGKQVLVRGSGTSGVDSFYDPESGELVGARYSNDFVIPPCCAVKYWPRRIECAEATITEVLCGEDSVQVGDTRAFR
ncbi:MAG: hypothetical protein GY842_25360 [bacterium]|nr:hypothetical protein [bacterium]